MKKSRTMKLVLIIISSVVVLIILLGAILFFMKRNESNNEDVQPTINTVVVEKDADEESFDETAKDTSDSNIEEPVLEKSNKDSMVLPDGYYTLASAIDDTEMLHPEKDSAGEGTGAELWDTSDLINEVYYFEKQEDGFFKIIHTASQLSLDVKDASAESGAKLQHRTYDGTKGQKWSVTADEEGYFTIASSLGTCLDCAGGAHENGTEILMIDDNGGLNQKWNLYRNGVYSQSSGLRTGNYQIASALNLNKVIVPEGGNLKNDTQIVLEDKNDDKQLYHIEIQSDGYYEILTADMSKSLSVKDASAENGAKLSLNEYSATIGQQWELVITEDGYFCISSPLGTYVDDPNGRMENGNAILMCEFNANPNQKWVLLPEGLKLGDMAALSVEGVDAGGTARVDETVESGLYQITSAMDDQKALHVAGESNAEGSKLEIMYKQKGTEYFTFFIGDNEDGTYRILSDATGGLSLDVLDASPESGAHLQMRTYDATQGQRWIITPSADRTRYIIRSELGTCLDVDYASVEDGTPVNMFVVTGADNQLWNLHRIG